jgi:hypothetical protein
MSTTPPIRMRGQSPRRPAGHRGDPQARASFLSHCIRRSSRRESATVVGTSYAAGRNGGVVALIGGLLPQKTPERTCRGATAGPGTIPACSRGSFFERGPGSDRAPLSDQRPAFSKV